MKKRLLTKKWLFAVLAVALIAGSVAIVSGRGAVQRAPTAEAAPAAQQSASAVVADARVVPVQSAATV